MLSGGLCRSTERAEEPPKRGNVTPKHGSWLNQVEIWLSILVRTLLRRGTFTSVEDLQAQAFAFIAYVNRTMAKPFKWTYQGKPLHA